MTTLYDTDFVAWAHEQAGLARRIANAPGVSRGGSVHSLDLANIAEELEGMVRAERRVLASQFRRLVAHLLKWRYQPDRRSRKWKMSILDARFQIERVLEDSSSLARDLEGIIKDEYPRAVRWAGDETGIARCAFPAACPWQRTELLDLDFLPDQEDHGAGRGSKAAGKP
jgi:hypothetical protein